MELLTDHIIYYLNPLNIPFSMDTLNFGSRKLVQNNRSFFVTLPKTWIRHHGLKKADLVQIILHPEGLLIKAVRK